MTGFQGVLSEALRQASEAPLAGSLEFATVSSIDPVTLDYRGTTTSDGLTVAPGLSLVVGSIVLVARFGAGSNIVFAKVS